MLGLEGWLTLAALGLMFAALVREWFSPEVTIFATVLGLWVGGVIDAREATAGFSSPQVLTVGMLFVVATAMRETGALSWVTRRVLGRGGSSLEMLMRLVLPTAALSAFMNNTPIVAMLTPEIRDWASRQGVAPSRFLMPLSFAAILGGTCTLIGTSTNLLVSGLMEAEGMAPMGMFELTPVGGPATAAGVLYLLTIGRRLIPDRQPPDDPRGLRGPEYSVRVEVLADGPLVGTSVEGAGLRHLHGLFLVEIERGERRIAPVRPSDRLEAGDQLVFFGMAEDVEDLLSLSGLRSVGDPHAAEGEEGETHADPRVLHEIVIPTGSPLVGGNLRDLRFRRRYDAAVVAIHRDGHRLHLKLGDVTLRPGDTLLVEAAKGFRDTWASTRDFVLLEARPPRSSSALSTLAIAVLALMVVAMASGAVSTLLAASLAAVTLILSGCVRASRARASVDLSVLVLMAASFGLGSAVRNSGLAELISVAARQTLGEFPPLVALAAVYLLCAVITEALSNTAAAALVFPVAMAVAASLGLDPRPFAVAVAVAASMSFVTPVGYQTNLLIYGPGGYRFSDFTRVGLPLALVCFVVAIAAIGLSFGLGG